MSNEDNDVHNLLYKNILVVEQVKKEHRLRSIVLFYFVYLLSSLVWNLEVYKNLKATRSQVRFNSLESLAILVLQHFPKSDRATTSPQSRISDGSGPRRASIL